MDEIIYLEKIIQRKIVIEMIAYKTFKLEDIFKINRGERQTETSRNKGDIPYYSASQDNNGITDFISNPTFVNKDKIVVSTFCHAYWAEDLFSASDEMTLLGHEKLNKNNALYVCKAIEKNSHMFGFNRKAFSNRLKNQKIILPINSNGFPDWKYMENFTKDQKHFKKREIIKFLKNELVKLDEFDTLTLSDIKWESFILGEIVEIKNGVRLTKNNMTDGETPFVGASDMNNGVTAYVGNDNKSIGSNVLGINYNGSVAEGFYHPYKALFSDDVKQLTFKDDYSNEYTLQFLNVVIRKQKDKFGYAYKFNSQRMFKQRIQLPVDYNGNLNYHFMENYIKGIKKQKINEVLNFLENQTKN